MKSILCTKFTLDLPAHVFLLFIKGYLVWDHFSYGTPWFISGSAPWIGLTSNNNVILVFIWCPCRYLTWLMVKEWEFSSGSHTCLSKLLLINWFLILFVWFHAISMFLLCTWLIYLILNIKFLMFLTVLFLRSHIFDFTCINCWFRILKTKAVRT